MKKRIFKTIDGKEIVLLGPENEEDSKKLREMQERGEIDMTDYMHGEKKSEQEKKSSTDQKNGDKK